MSDSELDPDITALGERIADLEEMLERLPSGTEVQQRLVAEIAHLRALQVLERERGRE